ncbi:hypothetical protein TRFO_13735 [Tritrichomonas foetus]|uniref:Uncharacterized protein n=1 Tax=Tritrichomonas foetus TaxID=1144522 RepID=A0A1J4KYD0_9EUKA|nr:hypothetical protein TRFO_13735 [Tritrichomonas foetus]|eukprot:OHT15888.1 hypothetical protein TRFO_13735 [Tritrichomonas foetus]
MTNEVSELKEKIQIHKTKLNDDEELARQHWHVIHDYTKRSKKKEIKAQKSRDNYSGLEERKLYLKNEIKNYHSIIAQTLDDILYKEREIKKTNKNIVELKEKKEIEFSLAQTKKDKIFELEQLKDNLTNSISNYKNEIVQMNKENSDISIYLNNILKVNSKQVAEFDDPVRLTERFVACLRPRRNAST